MKDHYPGVNAAFVCDLLANELDADEPASSLHRQAARTLREDILQTLGGLQELDGWAAKSKVECLKVEGLGFGGDVLGEGEDFVEGADELLAQGGGSLGNRVLGGFVFALAGLGFDRNGCVAVVAEVVGAGPHVDLSGCKGELEAVP